MIFIVLTDQGIETQPLVASSPADAADQLRQRYGLGPNGDGTGQTRFAVTLPTATGIVVANPDPTQATIQLSGDSAAQQQIRNNAGNALANNATYLALGQPTNAQVVAQVSALTRQVDGLIRLAVGDFSGTG